MNVDLPIRCSCGALKGSARGVSGQKIARVVCHCDDCQSFALFLGRADEVLDAHGGTDSLTTTLAHLEITEGADQLACMRLTAGGKFRWYAACCRTAIGSTFPSPQMPFVNVIHSCMDPAGDGRSLDEALGPVRFRVNGRFAKGDRSQLDAHPGIPISMFPVMAKVLIARLRGEASPSPFFDAATGEFRVVPHVLSEAELRQVRKALQPSAP